ncbi:hypothetical protein K8I28_05095 [bacterium]|nr:hypothetical protein [bacterium]
MGETVKLSKTTIIGVALVLTGVLANPWILALMIPVEGFNESRLFILITLLFDLMCVVPGALMLLPGFGEKVLRFTILVVVNGVLFLLLVEGSAFIWVKVFKEGPSPVRGAKGLSTTPLWVDVNPDWGVWHLPNTHNRQIRAEINAPYYYNEIGARDFDHPESSTKSRYLLLGDSFAEGYGVDTTNRFSNILAAKLETPILNFGTSGNFGTTQARLLYENLATSYDHEVVIMTILPENDFTDDDFSFGQEFFSNRYRPYLVPSDDSYSDFSIQYYLADLKKSDWYPENIQQRDKLVFYLGALFKTHTYAGSLYAMHQRIGSLKGSQEYFMAGDTTHSWYNGFEDRNYAVMEENILQVWDNCHKNNRKLLLMMIPGKADVYAFRNSADNRLTDNLTELADSTQGLYVIDLLPYFTQRADYSELYFTYDGHWNEKGHKYTADVLEEYIRAELSEPVVSFRIAGK